MVFMVLAGLLPSWCSLGRSVLPPPPPSRLGRCDWGAGADRQHIVHTTSDGSSEKEFRRKRQLTTGEKKANRKYDKVNLKQSSRVRIQSLGTRYSIGMSQVSYFWQNGRHELFGQCGSRSGSVPVYYEYGSAILLKTWLLKKNFLLKVDINKMTSSVIFSKNKIWNTLFKTAFLPHLRFHRVKECWDWTLWQ